MVVGRREGQLREDEQKDELAFSGVHSIPIKGMSQFRDFSTYERHTNSLLHFGTIIRHTTQASYIYANLYTQKFLCQEKIPVPHN